MKKTALAAAVIVLTVTGCTTAPTVANYNMGSDSAAIRAGRNRSDAIISQSELDQHRRQRQNVSEEMDLEAKKRNQASQSRNQTLSTMQQGASLIRGFVR